jgi:hypothetical protein
MYHRSHSGITITCFFYNKSVIECVFLHDSITSIDLLFSTGRPADYRVGPNANCKVKAPFSKSRMKEPFLDKIYNISFSSMLSLTLHDIFVIFCSAVKKNTF